MKSRIFLYCLLGGLPLTFASFGAGHFAWTDAPSPSHAAIAEYVRAFLDHTLKGKPFPSELSKPHPGVPLVKISE